jgi:histidine ammonia-lyase
MVNAGGVDTDVLALGKRPLTMADYERVVVGRARVELPASTRERMAAHRASLLRQLEAGVRMYGVNTGYGADSRNALDAADIRTVQRNTLVSHAVGTGDEVDEELVRGMLLLKAHVLAQGLSAVRPEVVELLAELLNRDIAPIVPAQGSLSASGDLVPQGHLGQALIGEGSVRVAGTRVPAAEALTAAGLAPLVPEEKEGLALVNGTAFTLAWAVRAIVDAQRLLRTADVVASMTLQAMRGFVSACDERVTGARPHPGALVVAANIRALTAGSTLADGPKSRVHDPYCLRCLPQVHGASRDAWAYAQAAIEIELDANSDNPLIFAESDEWVSGGNFHAQPLGIPMDTLAIAIAELASISQRRAQHLVSPVYQDGLPDKLSPHPERSIGLFMLNTTAASLVSENKTLCFPASVDSIAVDTTEDHVSMASVAARKATQVIRNTARTLAIELICASQALELQGVGQASAPARAVHAFVRQVVPLVDEDRSLYEEVAQMTDRVLAGDVARTAAADLAEPIA